MRKKHTFKFRKLTSEEKTNINILASLIIMGAAFLFLMYCFSQMFKEI